MQSSFQKGTQIILIVLFIIVLLNILQPKPEIMMFDIPPHIKNLLWIIFIISGVLLPFTYIQQPKPLPHPLQHTNNYEGTKSITGTVKEYGSNGVGDIDKILVQQSNQEIWLHFPPHTAQRVIDVAVINTTVLATVNTGKKPAIDNRLIYEVISLHSDALGKTINVHDITPPPPNRGKEVEITGSSIQIKLNEAGQARAFILSGNMIELRPHLSETLLPLLKQSNEIIVKGYERSIADGFVNSSNLPVIKPHSITIDKINYLIQ